MVRLLRGSAWAMGIACAAIGLLHLAAGVASVPGETGAGATVDSRERFYGAIFFGFGIAWVRVARRRPVPSGPVRLLASIFLLGGLGRVLSVLVHGWPDPFQTVLAALELALPFAFLWLATADEAASAGVVSAAVSSQARG